MHTLSRWVVAPAVAAPAVILLGAVLAGCSATSTPTATHTVTAPATRPAASTPTSTPTASTGGPTGTAVPGANPGTGPSPCTTDHLRGAFVGATAGASNVEEQLQLTNTGTTTCTVEGWPGVSLVGGGNGTQIGAAAAFDRSTAHATVTLRPGTTASAHFHYVQADAFDPAACKPVAGDGFRVFPPGSKSSIFIPAPGVRGCTAGGEKVFTVGAFG